MSKQAGNLQTLQQKKPMYTTDRDQFQFLQVPEEKGKNQMCLLLQCGQNDLLLAVIFVFECVYWQCTCLFVYKSICLFIY